MRIRFSRGTADGKQDREPAEPSEKKLEENCEICIWGGRCNCKMGHAQINVDGLSRYHRGSGGSSDPLYITKPADFEHCPDFDFRWNRKREPRLKPTQHIIVTENEIVTHVFDSWKTQFGWRIYTTEEFYQQYFKDAWRKNVVDFKLWWCGRAPKPEVGGKIDKTVSENNLRWREPGEFRLGRTRKTTARMISPCEVTVEVDDDV